MEREELENMSKFAKAKQKMSRLTKEKQNELFQIKQKAKEDNAKKLDEKYQVKKKMEVFGLWSFKKKMVRLNSLFIFILICFTFLLPFRKSPR